MTPSKGSATTRAKKRMPIDPQCRDLAEHFAYGEGLSEEEVTDLAEEFQRVVDGWFNERNARSRP